MTTYTASIDVGTTNTKINIFDENYRVIDMMKYPHEKIHKTEVVFEMDFEEIWEHIIEGLALVTDLHDYQKLEIVLTTAMHSVQLMDRDNKLVGSVITWADKRGADQLEKLSAAKLNNRYKRTGTPNHSMNPYFTLLEMGDDLKDKRIGSLKDLLFYRLTGDWALDISNASSSGIFNTANKDWDQATLDELGISQTQLPQVKSVDYHAPAKSLIFQRPTDVFIGTSDGVSSNFVFNNMDEPLAVLSIGTSHAVRVIHNTPQVNPAYGNFAYVIDDKRYLIGLPSNNGGDVLNWAVNVFDSSYEEISDIIKQGPQTDALFMPYINGERAPVWNEFATASLSKATRSDTRESILYAVILGMIFNIKHNLTNLEDLAAFDAVGLVGGITDLPGIAQLIADVLGKKIYIPTLPNAETLGTISLVKNKVFKADYDILNPVPDEKLTESYRKYRRQVELDYLN